MNTAKIFFNIAIVLISYMFRSPLRPSSACCLCKTMWCYSDYLTCFLWL